jgi:hypothetical protein
MKSNSGSLNMENQEISRSTIMTRTIASATAVFCLAAAVVGAEPDPKTLPIDEIRGLRPEPAVFKAAQRGKPIELRSGEEAQKFFTGDALESLKKQVDFAQQFVLIFAWRGSGQDKLKYDVAESYPEQVTFRVIPGRTRDLRPHVHVFSLRSNVRWSVAGRKR